MNAGQQLGEYVIEAEIGGGGMAKVYRARHAVLDTLHALKVLDAEFRTNAEVRRRFLDEAKIQAKHLQHPNIVKVTNIVATADAAALVMELVEGGNLEAFIERRKTPCNADDFLALAVPILDAIGHAHDAGIIHRDIKPANVLLRKSDGRLVPAITDFGIAKVTDTRGPVAKRHTHHEARMGTLGYISPEQIRKAKDVTTRSDIFSLGAMFYELATGRVPFDGDSDFDIMEKIVHGTYEPPERLADPKLPARICAAIRKALVVRAAVRVLDPPTTTNLIAIAAPMGGRGPYWPAQIENILVTAYTGFAAALGESRRVWPTALVEVRTGFWGCGAFGGNRRAMTLLQILAARLAGVGRLVFHVADDAGLAAYHAGVADLERLLTGGREPLTALLERIADLDYQWGTSDGN